jgi:hypothetical protein
VPLVLASTQRGPVARVRDLDGHCAPLMDGLPPFRRDVVDCVTTGTLLTLADGGDGIGNGAPPHLEVYDGTTFVGVLTLDGAPAWVERAHVDVDLAGPD